MCECYKIGGPWIAEDPNCPVHGRVAQYERENLVSDIRSYLEGCIEALEKRIEALENK